MPISPAELDRLRTELSPLLNVQFDILKLPRQVLGAFEPSQIGTMIGVMMDACIPNLAQIINDGAAFERLGLRKHPGVLGEREGYPDYLHDPTGYRLELKLIYVDPVGVTMKKPPTPREASARLTQKVTVKNVDPDKDALLVVAYQLRPTAGDPQLYSPTVIDLEVFSMIDCISARDKRLTAKGGRWMGDNETPVVLSMSGRQAVREGRLIEGRYGLKASEGHHYNEDSNFGKLARIPYAPLKEFLGKHGAVLHRRRDRAGAGGVQGRAGRGRVRPPPAQFSHAPDIFHEMP